MKAPSINPARCAIYTRSLADFAKLKRIPVILKHSLHA
jgi:hypothetical protein